MKTKEEKKVEYDARKKKRGLKEYSYFLSEQQKRKVDRFIKELQMNNKK